jgi:hypothetical protein
VESNPLGIGCVTVVKYLNGFTQGVGMTLISIKEWFFQNRPRTWGLLYLVAIPAFGSFYAFAIPNSFFAPYAQSDPDLTVDRVAVTASLQVAVTRAYEPALRQAIGNLPSGGSLNAPSAENLRLETSSDGSPLLFTINWLGPSPFYRGYVRRLWPLVTATIKRITVTPPNNSSVLLEIRKIPYNGARSDVMKAGEEFFSLMFKGQKEYLLPLSIDEASKISAYLHGVQGQTASYSNNIVRMMYLSTVVQTTLGLGDLLPMTTCARIAVGLQAIIGIVIAGFFLNAAAKGAKGRADELPD